MTTLAYSLPRVRSSIAYDAVLVVLGSLLMAGLAQIAIPLQPFSPVPITGQTLGVLLIGASLGAWRGGASMLLYLAWGAIGLPFFAEGESGAAFLTSAATAGYLWGFVVAAVVVGFLAEKGWDRGLGSALGAMLVGEIIVFTLGVWWLVAGIGLPLQTAFTQGLYPFLIGDLLKLLVAAGALPTAWKLVRR